MKYFELVYGSSNIFTMKIWYDVKKVKVANDIVRVGKNSKGGYEPDIEFEFSIDKEVVETLTDFSNSIQNMVNNTLLLNKHIWK